MKYLFITACAFLVIISCKTEKETTVANEYYAEDHRPQFHFSPEANWMNDPNGMVFYEGEYHLFYQYYPDSTVWGPMHWGHAVSTDMVHWEHLPIALYPDSLGYIFSGSAVIDWKNTSGLGTGNQPPMIAIFTHHEPNGARAETNTFQYQSIAYSNDKGRSWTKYAGNPVLPNSGVKDFRDPKVIWDDDSEQWVMVLAVDDHAEFWGSENLINWTHLSDWGKEYGAHDGVWECPDLFPMKVTGSDEQKWVLIQSINPGGPNGGSGTQYFIGDFNGREFILDEEFKRDVLNENAVWLDYGTDNYAGVTWSDVPEEDGRRLFLGWMSNWSYAQIVPTEKWRSAMTLPWELTLNHEERGYRLLAHPVAELEKLEGAKKSVPAEVYKENYTLSSDSGHYLYKLDLKFKKPTSGLIEIRFSNKQEESLSVGFSVADQQYFVDRTFAGKSDFEDDFADYHVGYAPYNSENVEMTLYLDHASVELFADGGRCVMTEIFFPTELYSKIELIAENNDVELLEGTITELKGIWR